MASWIFTFAVLCLISFTAVFGRGVYPNDLILRMKMLKSVPTDLKSFVFTNCGDPHTDLVNVSSFAVGPDPIVLPGTINLQFNVEVKQDLVDNLKAIIVMKEKPVNSKSWRHIPCIAEIGSCTYENLCDLLSAFPDCPGAFQAIGSNCRCPFKKGRYNLPPTSLTIPIPLLSNQDLNYQARLFYQDRQAACVDIQVTFA